MKPYKCADCGNTFTQSGTWRRHLRIQHEVVRVYECYICGDEFQTKNQLHAHQDVIHGGRSGNGKKEAGDMELGKDKIDSKKNEQEPSAEYCVGGYHPARFGDILNQRYFVVKKLGFGLYSTVWLFFDLIIPRFVIA